MRRLVFTLAVVLLVAPAWADPAGEEFFENEVRPILVARCYECHAGGKADPKGGLRVDSRDALLAGGDTGPALKPGAAKESLLIDAVNYGDLYKMPPKTKLPEREIAILTKWVDRGAPWPKDPAAATAGTKKKFDLALRKADWWCWQPVKQHAPPKVHDAAWPRDDLDRFILAGLEQAGVKPAPPADKRTLIRRASFLLIGLPPTPEEVAAFSADDTPQAFAKVVDRLLNSPHFGERWARHWLDLVRYAESRGHEFEPNIPNAWQYRDYVIRALSADTPYDQFVREHLAGDLLQPPRLHPERGFNESQLGTGFWFLGEEVHSPVDIRKDETDRLDNRLDVAAKTFLGLTVACARCHDHKFDAISQKDYYALMGCLISSSYRQALFETEAHNGRLARELRTLRQRSQAELAEERLAALRTLLSAGAAPLLSAAQALRDEASGKASVSGTPGEQVAAWKQLLQAAGREANSPLAAVTRLLLEPADKEPTPAEFAASWRKLLPARAPNTPAVDPAAGAVVVDFASPQPGDWSQDGFAFELLAPGQPLFAAPASASPLVGWADRGQVRFDPVWRGLKLAPGADRDHGALGGWDRSGKTFRTREFTLSAPRLWCLVQGSGRAYAAVHSHLIIAGPLHGALLMEWQGKPDQWQWVSHNLGAYPGSRLHVEFSPKGEDGFAVAKVVASDKAPPLPGPALQGWLAGTDAGEAASTPPASRAALAQELIQRLSTALAAGKGDRQDLPSAAAAGEFSAARNWLLGQAAALAPAQAPAAETPHAARFLAAQQALLAQVQWESQAAPVMADGNGVDEQLLIRGNSRTPGAPVARRFLEALDPQTVAYGAASSGRLALAQQIASAENPLTARVMANRLWHHTFGRGLAASVDNFGVLGEKPTHPELLDYLAREFTRDGWSVKRLLRRLVLSRTFEMSSQEPDDPALAQKLAELDPLNLLWRRANQRRLEGEAIRDAILSVSGRLDPKPFGKSVPVHLTPFMQGRGRPGASGPLDGDGRRSIYIAIRRNFLPPMMLAFDMPIPFNTVGRRNVSNVPAQALILMNDPFVAQQAEVWARRLLAEAHPTPDARIARAYELAYARPPSSSELQAAVSFLSAQATEYSLPASAAASDPRCWTDLCHVLLNVKEFVYLP